jgi:hypothetical protein
MATRLGASKIAQHRRLQHIHCRTFAISLPPPPPPHHHGLSHPPLSFFTTYRPHFSSFSSAATGVLANNPVRGTASIRCCPFPILIIHSYSIEPYSTPACSFASALHLLDISPHARLFSYCPPVFKIVYTSCLRNCYPPPPPLSRPGLHP